MRAKRHEMLTGAPLINIHYHTIEITTHSSSIKLYLALSLAPVRLSLRLCWNPQLDIHFHHQRHPADPRVPTPEYEVQLKEEADYNEAI